MPEASLVVLGDEAVVSFGCGHGSVSMPLDALGGFAASTVKCAECGESVDVQLPTPEELERLT
jgi:hypothetical protein